MVRASWMIACALSLGAWFSASAAVAEGVKLDPKLPEYKQAEGIKGSIKSTGSDTMNNLMTFWAEGFKKMYPSVEIEIEGKGSATAPPALIGGTANFGPMSRDMKKEEADAFEAKFGYKATKLPTSIDMLAVYVHKDNPLKNLTLAQADAIFSSTRKRGNSADIRTWGDLGLTGDFASAPIGLYGRNSSSGTYSYFKEHVLQKGDFKDSVKEQPGSSAVVQGISNDKFGVGYSGIGYKTEGVRALPLAEKAGGKFIEAVGENAYTGEYPLARPLLLYVNYKPGSELDPLRREFLKYVFSKEGQALVLEDGYFPLTAEGAAAALKSVGIEAGK